MNLRFRLIWIEDSFSEPEKQKIEEGIRLAGFEPDLEIDPDGSKIDGFAERHRLYSDTDFLLLDLNLANGVHGDDLAPRIREKFRSTPMLFYSSVPAEQLRRLMLEKNVEGVFCSHRDDMPGRVAEMVGHLSVSLNRLGGMRGLAARVVAECDDEFRAIIREACARPGECDQATVCGQLDELVKDAADKSRASYALCSDLESRLASRSITSFHLWKVVLQITKGARLRIPKISGCRVVLGDYNPKVIEPRNSLSHVLEDTDEGGWTLVGHKADNSITVGDFPQLRHDFVLHLENIKAIRLLLAGKQP